MAPDSGDRMGSRQPAPIEADDAARRPDLLVVGAGVMGSWTAFWAQAGGAGPTESAGGGRRVALIDAWGAGHARATSGHASRILRSAHGDDALYADWARRARTLWQRFEREWDEQLFVETGVLWFGHETGGFEDRSAAILAGQDIPHELLSPDEVRKRWPQIGTEGMTTALWEPEAGTLLARHSVQATVAAFQRSGGTYAVAAVRPGRTSGERLLSIVDLDGQEWSAETFVFACGPWLPKLFPDQLGDLVRVTKQDVIYLGAPAGRHLYAVGACPAWADHAAAYYGVPALGDDGFKIAPDRYGPVFDPSAGERLVDPDSGRLARRYLAQRFPGLAGAPITNARVCQYETSPDGHFLIGLLPGYSNVWILGAGSGHGFKHGPFLGSYAIARIDGVPEGAQFGPDEKRFRVGPRQSSAAAGTGRDVMARAWDLF